MGEGGTWPGTVALDVVDEPHELVEEDVLGAPMLVYRHRARSLVDVLRRSAARFADRDLYVFGERRTTYAEHLDWVATTATVLRDAYRVGEGDRVGILAANRPEWLVTYWAALSLGAIPVGMNAWWAGDEVRYALGDCTPTVLVADRRRLERLDGDPGVPVLTMDDGTFPAVAPGTPLPETAVAEDDPAVILYTSGTTGRPKGATLSHRNVVHLLCLQSHLPVSRGAPMPRVDAPPMRPFVNNPLFHVSGVLNACTFGLSFGSTLVLFGGRFEPGEVLEIIERERCTSWSMVPTTAWRLANHPDLAKRDLSSLVQIGGGAAFLSEALLERLKEVLPRASARMGWGYGQTECSSLATSAGAVDLAKNPATVGRPLPTVEVEIRDADANGEGDIHVRSPLVMLGYWGRPEATAETILPGRWLRTGDIGRFVDGELVLSSRRSDLILRGGENVYPAEIENCLEAHPAVAECVVVGIPDDELGQRVKAIVVPRGEVGDAELVTYLRERLAYYKVPEVIELRAEPLPRTATGKVIRPAIA